MRRFPAENRAPVLASYLCAFLFIYPLFSQTLSPNLIGSAGGSLDSADIYLDWSLGEPATGPYGQNTTFGYQQFYLEDVTPMQRPRAALPSIRIRKKPEFLSLQINPASLELSVQLINIKGQSIKTFTIEKGRPWLNMPIRYFRSNVVFIKIFTKDRKLVKSFKLVRGEGR